jgi:hypothetical protein
VIIHFRSSTESLLNTEKIIIKIQIADVYLRSGIDEVTITQVTCVDPVKCHEHVNCNYVQLQCYADTYIS